MYAIDHVTGCCLVNIIRRCVSLEATKYFYLETYLLFDITMCIALYPKTFLYTLFFKRVYYVKYELRNLRLSNINTFYRQTTIISFDELISQKHVYFFPNPNHSEIRERIIFSFVSKKETIDDT